MLIQELAKKGIPKIIINRLRASGIKRLNPPQIEAIEKGILDGKNMTISIPTASGKTLIALLGICKQILQKSKVVYVVPLRALANEKFEEFKEIFDGICKIGLSTGEFDSQDLWLGDCNIIIVTIEKLDSLIRHSAPWLKQVKMMILDEVHLIGTDRGPTLEMVAGKMREIGEIQIISLSATIKNSEEIARWLESDLVESTYRPIPLNEGIYVSHKMIFKNKSCKVKSKYGPPLLALIDHTLNEKKQSLIFVNTRRRAEAVAERLGPIIASRLEIKERKMLEKLAKKIEGTLEISTEQCRRLARCVRCGSGFHHSAIMPKQRWLIEKSFKEGLIKVLVATPTLAAGVNLPARQVIVADYRRYGQFGLEPIPVMEIKQFFGRAGRPKYDKEGDALLIASNESEFEQLWEHYIEGEPEDVISRLGQIPQIRMHLLGYIANKSASIEQVNKFFAKTFYGIQYGVLETIRQIIQEVSDELEEWGFIKKIEGQLIPTQIGKRVAELYIDPLSAHNMICFLQKKPRHDLQFLHMISMTSEMRPLPKVRKSEMDLVDMFIDTHPETFKIFDIDLNEVKNTLILDAWINEVSEQEILETYHMPPGILYRRRENVDWLLYACSELAKICKMDVRQIRELRVRVRYGVRSELLPLVHIRGIGRVRARRLWKLGIHNTQDILKNPKKFIGIVGQKIGQEILEQLNQMSQVAQS